MPGVLDQHSDTTGVGFGFGEFAGVRYRGQCFTPAIGGKLVSLGFHRATNSKGVKVYIDTTSGNVPGHAVGSELYSWEIALGALTNGYAVYDLPVGVDLTPGVQYCFYIAPWDTSAHTYADDYADFQGTNSGTKEITNNNGVFSNENLTVHFATYMLAPAFIVLRR